MADLDNTVLALSVVTEIWSSDDDNIIVKFENAAPQYLYYSSEHKRNNDLTHVLRKFKRLKTCKK